MAFQSIISIGVWARPEVLSVVGSYALEMGRQQHHNMATM